MFFYSYACNIHFINQRSSCVSYSIWSFTPDRFFLRCISIYKHVLPADTCEHRLRGWKYRITLSVGFKTSKHHLCVLAANKCKKSDLACGVVATNELKETKSRDIARGFFFFSFTLKCVDWVRKRLLPSMWTTEQERLCVTMMQHFFQPI